MTPRIFILCCLLCLVPLTSAGLDSQTSAVLSVGDVERAESALDDLVPHGDNAMYRERAWPQVEAKQLLRDSPHGKAYAVSKVQCEKLLTA